MDDPVLKKIRNEFRFMNVILGWSVIPLTIFLTNWFFHIGQEPLFTLSSIVQLVIGIILIALSVTLYLGMHGIWKEYNDFFQYPDYFFTQVKGEELKNTISGLVRDVVAFNRTYYSSMMALMILAVSYLLASLTTAIIGLMFEYINAFLIFCYVAVMLFYIILLFFFGVRLWRGRLVGIKQSEKELADMLGGPLEA